ncbi:preprotein translocase subunit SecY [Arthrobacter sp. SORGH_AS 212]|uniref:hypothetical protein n=1 Tax=Pseudarthrobacter sp. SORGH_AS 212 TaxID=3041777 RepID=UPI002781EDA7|nr:preprotein translocase subunit SecY [Arthrobacter sp. SORGH_AS_0212]
MSTTRAEAGRIPAAALAWLPGPIAAGLGLLAHVLGGGASPSPPIVVALAALLGMAAAIGKPGRLPGWGLLLTAGIAQQLLHFAFADFSVSTGFDAPAHDHGQSPVQDPGTANQGHTQGAVPHDLHLLLYLHMAAALLTVFATRQLDKIPVRRSQRNPIATDGGVPVRK